MKGLITICARGGSKGIPGKNIKFLNGKPLIYYTVRIAELFRERHDVDIVLSTDDIEIKNTVKSYCGEVIWTDYVRPERLALDSSGKLDAIVDVKDFCETLGTNKYDYVMDLDVTSPLRTVEDLEDALIHLFSNKDALNLFSVNLANRNPYFNMVEENADGFFSLCKKGEFLTRQSSPKVYDLNASFYIYKQKFFEEIRSTVITEKSLIYEMSHICFDLDHQIDFEILSLLVANNKLNFPFVQ